ncbi:MAG: lipoyl(octanoyl) transferase LipB [Pseudomonadota bacterium]
MTQTDETPRDCDVMAMGMQPYEPMWQRMQRFTDARDNDTDDVLWFCEHPPVFTLGMAAKREHVLAPGAIPLVQIDRGGQVTYHGPGQLMVYPLINVRRHKLGVRDLVCALERSVIDLLAASGIAAIGRRDAPGVYVDGAKVASIGLRIRRGCSYHGMAVNVAMDLSPFERINPCGMEGLKVTDLASLGLSANVDDIATQLTPYLGEQLKLRMRLAR